VVMRIDFKKLGIPASAKRTFWGKNHVYRKNKIEIQT
jgi:hypothetical protein